MISGGVKVNSLYIRSEIWIRSLNKNSTSLQNTSSPDTFEGKWTSVGDTEISCACTLYGFQKSQLKLHICGLEDKLSSTKFTSTISCVFSNCVPKRNSGYSKHNRTCIWEEGFTIGVKKEITR